MTSSSSSFSFSFSMNATNLASSCPGSLKVCVPYLQRVPELLAAEGGPQRELAHYCKLYAVEVGLAVPGRGGAEGKAFLAALMDEIEREAATLPKLPPEQAKDLVNAYALQVFSSADEAERRGECTKAVVRAFYVSSVLMDIGALFATEGQGGVGEGEGEGAGVGVLDSDVAEKRKYARVMATQMKRALDSGVPYQSSSTLTSTSASTSTVADSSTVITQDSTTYLQGPFLSPPPPPAPPTFGAPSGFPPPPVPARPPPPELPTSSNGGWEPSFEAVQEAQKYSKWATSALQFQDVNAAVVSLQAALELLLGTRQPPLPPLKW